MAALRRLVRSERPDVAAPEHVGISQDAEDHRARQCRYDACIEVDAGFQPKDEVGVQTIWGGRYACARFTGAAADIHAAWMRFIGEWIPDSGYQCENHPALELYEPDFTVDPDTGVFSCRCACPSARSERRGRRRHAARATITVSRSGARAAGRSRRRW